MVDRSAYHVSLTVILLLLSITLTVFLHPRTVDAQTPEELASTYAPVLHFTGGEKFYPTSVDYIIGSSTLKQRNSDGSSTLVDSSPTKFNLGSYGGTDLFLNNYLATFEAIAADYAQHASSAGYFAYVHVTSSGGGQVIQYWLFYAFNNGPLNDHQGDIEVIEVFLDGSGNPSKALYSQHGAGENARWGDVEKVDTHPVVYVAQGSHANYFRSYQGRIGIENDVVGSDGLTIMPSNLNLVMLGEAGSHPADQGWLDFAGRWGFWGTDEDAALGKAGPLGPAFNQNGVRWSDAEAYLSQTLGVDGTYFLLAWFLANILLLFLIYFAVRAGWKIWGITKLHRKGGGLRVKRFLKERRGMIGLILVFVSIAITIVALFLPWFVISASSESGPLAGAGGVNLLSIDGVNGMRVNMFLGSDGDSTSGFRSLFSFGFPFMLFILVGVVLLVLDVIGVKSGKSLGLKLLLGTVVLFLPLILIIVFMAELPSFLPWASGLVPSGTVPSQVETVARSIASSPIYGSSTQTFPVVGSTTVTWGIAIGIYLFIVAAAVRIAGGIIMLKAPELQQKPSSPPPSAARSTERMPSPPTQEPSVGPQSKT
jgi:hypothetical protein